MNTEKIKELACRAAISKGAAHLHSLRVEELRKAAHLDGYRAAAYVESFIAGYTKYLELPETNGGKA